MVVARIARDVLFQARSCESRSDSLARASAPFPTTTSESFGGAFIATLPTYPIFPSPLVSSSPSSNIIFLGTLLAAPITTPADYAQDKAFQRFCLAQESIERSAAAWGQGRENPEEVLDLLNDPRWSPGVFRPHLLPCPFPEGRRAVFDSAHDAHHGMAAFYELLAHFGPTAALSARPAALASKFDLAVASAERRAVRRAARARVYDMTCLRRSRLWGPFLPVLDGPPSNTQPAASGFPDQAEAAASINHNPGAGPSGSATSELGNDASAMSVEANVSQGVHNASEDGNDDEDAWEDVTVDITEDTNEGDDDDEALGDPFLALATLPPATPGDKPPPGPLALEPDWPWLAAARIVVEANLREAVTNRAWEHEDAPHSVLISLGHDWPRQRILLQGLRILCDVRGLRARSVVYTNGSQPEEAIPFHIPRAPTLPTDDVHDWAHATGVWRRCGCWLDYRDLLREVTFSSPSSPLAHACVSTVNHMRPRDQRYTAPSLGEAVRVIPMTLRAVGIDEEALAAERATSENPWPARPPLHLEGASLRDQGAPARRVRGCVRMTGDAHVRWTLVSFSNYLCRRIRAEPCS
jgi:hypothetical protein